MNYLDLHCDTATKWQKQNLTLQNNSLAVSSLKGEVIDNWTQTFAIFINDDCKKPWQEYLNTLQKIKIVLKNKPNNLTTLLSVEGGALLEENIERLDQLKSDGIKFLTLTWNGENSIAGGCKTNKGLTTFGKTVIEKMNRLKIGCDLSHINEKSFYSAVEIADFPLATHSNCYKLCEHPRNLKDEQLKLIAQKGGIIGLCFYPKFLKDDIFDSIYQNIYCLCEMGLEKHIAIGSDFDGGVMSNKLDGIDKIPSLYKFLKDKKIPKTVLNGIFYKNAENYVAKL